MSKQSRTHEFSAKEREYIKMRDFGQCIFCMAGYEMDGSTPEGLSMKSIMHFVPRSQGGLGIAENGAIGCQWHHEMMDNGNRGNRDEMLDMFEQYLRRHHPGWDKSKLYYRKYGF